MKACSLWVLFLTLVIALTWLGISSNGSTSTEPDEAFINHGNAMAQTTASMKLKAVYAKSKKGSHGGGGYMGLEDYHPVDPVPSSKASIRPGPIQHGSPLIPFIPKPSPPINPRT